MLDDSVNSDLDHADLARRCLAKYAERLALLRKTDEHVSQANVAADIAESDVAFRERLNAEVGGSRNPRKSLIFACLPVVPLAAVGGLPLELIARGIFDEGYWVGLAALTAGNLACSVAYLKSPFPALIANRFEPGNDKDARPVTDLRIARARELAEAGSLSFERLKSVEAELDGYASEVCSREDAFGVSVRDNDDRQEIWEQAARAALQYLSDRGIDDEFGIDETDGPFDSGWDL